ncbi:MAG: aminopeptidase [Armatimonadetes bacterium]|nr:aminopeptidase [Candidatus Hippobium faecium]
MRDPRFEKLAKLLVNYSVNVQPGEKVMVNSSIDVPEEFDVELVRAIGEAGGLAFISTYKTQVAREEAFYATKELFQARLKYDLQKLKDMDCSISISGMNNECEYIDTPQNTKTLGKEYYGQYTRDIIIDNAKWVGTHWPTPGFAQKASMSTASFEDFYFDVVLLDYAKLKEGELILIDRMEKTDKVHILGPGKTDLTFSIKGMPAVGCWGDRNIPDGEVYTAPIRDSINGFIQYNCPTVADSKPVDDVWFVFKDGKIVEEGGSDVDAVRAILNDDEGARYIGEFALGVNPKIKVPMRNILFDEKISGSIHLTPGRAYKEAYNGNDSKQHWDLVMIQTPEYGGGEIWFDDELIRKDGLFVPDYLKTLNPENFEI